MAVGPSGSVDTVLVLLGGKCTGAGDHGGGPRDQLFPARACVGASWSLGLVCRVLLWPVRAAFIFSKRPQSSHELDHTVCWGSF